MSHCSSQKPDKMETAIGRHVNTRRVTNDFKMIKYTILYYRKIQSTNRSAFDGKKAAERGVHNSNTTLSFYLFTKLRLFPMCFVVLQNLFVESQYVGKFYYFVS